MPSRRATLHIDTAQFRANIQALKHELGDTKLMMVIKANAYGHGASTLAPIAETEGVDYFAVATLSEALALRKMAITTPILILSQPITANLDDIVTHNITQTVTDIQFAKKLAACARLQNKTINIHIKIDTGMGRMGPQPDDAMTLYTAIQKLPELHIEGIMSHFANAEIREHPLNSTQLRSFDDLANQFNASIRHMANTNGMYIPNAHYDMVRIGLGCYQNIMSLTSQIIEIKQLKAGQSISYGSTYTLTQDSDIAIIPVGYADGYPTELSNCGQVRIADTYYPIRGRVTMNFIMVELGPSHNIKIGDTTLLIETTPNSPINLTQISSITHRNERELSCRLGHK